VDELFKRLWAKFYGWALPSALAIGAFLLVVYPKTQFAHSIFDVASDSEKLGAFASLAALLAFLLNAFSTQLYRILEGYLLWPHFLQKWRATKQTDHKAKLLTRMKGGGWLQGLAFEEFALYPEESDQITPTKLGNALRAFERYGHTRYNLNSLSVWYELYAVSPKSVRTAIVESRSAVDFFVATFYLGVGSSLLTAVLWILGDRDLQVSIFILGSFIVGLLGYWSAVRTTRDWAAAERAMVNIGRKELAARLGLELPTSLEDEREMWRLVTSYVDLGEAEAGAALDKFRAKASLPSV
jgi:hypothetical protein